MQSLDQLRSNKVVASPRRHPCQRSPTFGIIERRARSSKFKAKPFFSPLKIQMLSAFRLRCASSIFRNGLMTGTTALLSGVFV